MIRQASRPRDTADRREPHPIATAADAANALCGLLDQWGTGALLLDADGEILGMGAAAAACMGEGLLIRDRRLAAADLRTNRALAGLIDDTLGRRGGTSTDDGVIVERRDARPLIVRALPLDGQARSAFHPARAMVIILDAARVMLPTERQLGSMFALSRGEARVARRLAAGDTLAAAAQLCGISYETARKRLKGAFAKTDTRRQAELVALIIRIGSIFGVACDATAAKRFQTADAQKPTTVATSAITLTTTGASPSPRGIVASTTPSP